MSSLAFKKAKNAQSSGRPRMSQSTRPSVAALAPPSPPVNGSTTVRRKENLLRYARETKRDADQLATQLMLSSRRIEELLSGRAPISDELATHIEEMLQLPASWLDNGSSLALGAPTMLETTERPLSTPQETPRPAAGDKKQIYENRRLNLTMLTAERGAKNRLAQLAGTSGSRISLMTSARKPVSEPFAAGIENGLGLPRGWLDQPRTADAVPASVWEALRPAEDNGQPASVTRTQIATAPRAKAPVRTTHAPAVPTPQPAIADEPTSTTGLFNKSAGQCGPIAEALAKTIINLSTTDKLSEARAFQMLGEVIAATERQN